MTWCLIFSDSKKTEHLERVNLCLQWNWSNHRIVALLCCCTFSWTCTHTSCYAAVPAVYSYALAHTRHAISLHVCVRLHTYVMLPVVRSHALAHIRHATLLYFRMHWHTYVLVRCCTFSCTCTHTSCYAGVRFHAFAHIRPDRPLHVCMHLYTYVMLRCCTFSCTCTHTKVTCYGYVIEEDDDDDGEEYDEIGRDAKFFL